MEFSEDVPHKAITFMDAYKSRIKGRSSTGHISHIPRFEGMSSDLQNLVLEFERDRRTALQQLSKILKNISTSNRPLLQSWTDAEGYDILHHAIMNNRSEIIQYLLREENLFPQKYQPKSSPYAHMAAVVGFKTCLEAILTHRQEDYFKATEPHHTLNLPPALIQRLKLKQSSGAGDKFLSSIKKDVNGEIEMSQAGKESKPNQDFFEDEYEDFKKTFSERKSKPRKVYAVKEQITTVTKHDGKKLPPKIQPDELKLPPLVRKFSDPKRSKPKITIHWNVFKDDDSGGVVAGAGQPVTVHYAEENAEKRCGVFKKAPERKDKGRHRTSVSLKPESAGTSSRRGSTKSLLHNSSSVFANMGRDTRKSSVHEGQIRLQNKPSSKKIELGIRKFKPEYNTLSPNRRVAGSDSSSSYLAKTPLTLAAEHGHFECVKYLLEFHHLSPRKLSRKDNRDYLTWATQERCPEAIAVLLEHKANKRDFQSAVMMSIRESIPDCLMALLAFGSKEREELFSGKNLFHVLYTQSLTPGYRYDMLPEMTQVIIDCKENVNARTPPQTFPLYTLIKCAFNAINSGECLSYLTCLKMLLNANADPNFNEKRIIRRSEPLNISRPSFSSAIQCVLMSAQLSVQLGDKTHWTQILMQKFIVAIEANDQTPRRIKHEVLFLYMELSCELGLNRRVLRALLRYGADPDCSVDGMYALNMFFETTHEFLTKYKVKQKYYTTDDMLDTLLLLCRAMSPNCLHEATILFLDEHLLSAPLQALELIRKFCYRVDIMIRSPRSLAHIASLFIWQQLDRNVKRLRQLGVGDELMNQILP